MAVLIITMDDLIDQTQKWENAFALLYGKGLFCTAGVITKSYRKRLVDWDFIKSHVENGLIEIASHSRTHNRLPYKDYDSEIGGSKQDIFENLNMNTSSWICPHGRWDEIILKKLEEYGYSVFRGGNRKSSDFRRGELWKVSHSIEIGEGPRMWSDVRLLNNLFKNAWETGGAYHLMVHPAFVNWGKGKYVDQHLNYILEHDVSSMTLGEWRKSVE